jgi:hypothetical protein
MPEMPEDLKHLSSPDHLKRIERSIETVREALSFSNLSMTPVQGMDLLYSIKREIADVIQKLERPSVPAVEETPDDGHTWRFTAECRGSYAVVGEPHHDVEEFDQPVTFEVRAWSLSVALEKASRLPFQVLVADLEDELDA